MHSHEIPALTCFSFAPQNFAQLFPLLPLSCLTVAEPIVAEGSEDLTWTVPHPLVGGIGHLQLNCAAGQ